MTLDISKAKWMKVQTGLSLFLSTKTMRVGALFSFNMQMSEHMVYSPDIRAVSKEYGPNGEHLLGFTLMRTVDQVLLDKLSDVQIFGPAFAIIRIEQDDPQLISSARSEEMGFFLGCNYSFKFFHDSIYFSYLAKEGSKI